MISLYVTCLWLQRNGGGSRWRKCNRCKTNEKWGFGKVAQMSPSGQMREPSGEQEVCVVSLSLRIYETIDSLPVALISSSLVYAECSTQQLRAQQSCAQQSCVQQRFPSWSLHLFRLWAMLWRPRIALKPFCRSELGSSKALSGLEPAFV